MSSNSNLSLSNEEQPDVALMQDLLSNLSGEGKMQLAHLSHDELLTKLSFCLECEKKELENLFVSHDQNQLLNMVTVANLWKQVKRGVVKAQKSAFANLPAQVFENIVFQTHFKFKDTKAAELASVADKPIARGSAVLNDWSQIIKNTTVSDSMVQKVEASRANDNLVPGSGKK